MSAAMDAEYIVRLTRAADEPVSVQYATRDGTARAGVDYMPQAGAVEFAPGETRKTVAIRLVSRPGMQLPRDFDVVLTAPVNAEIAEAVGVCTILPISQVTGPGGSDTVAVPDQQRPLGPLVKHGLITRAYHNANDGPSPAGGTAQAQAVAIRGALQAFLALRDDDTVNAQWYRTLALSMADAMSDGAGSGPILRQALPSVATTLTLPNGAFAARGAIQSQAIVYDYPATVSNGKLAITEHAADVFQVWAIYPASSHLLYENPYSPAYDTESPTGPTQEAMPSWQLLNGQVVIDAAGKSGDWRVIYGYRKAGTLVQGWAMVGWPCEAAQAASYASGAADALRDLDIALELLIANETRANKIIEWTQLRDAMRRTAVRGQAVSDLREVFKPLPGLPVLPQSGEPQGMSCYSNHPAATPPPSGFNQDWIGYNFWSRETAGAVLGTVPVAGQSYRVELSRRFNDSWREATGYQDADQYLWVALSCSLPLTGGKLYAVVSSTTPDGGTTRWYADMTAMAAWASVTAAFVTGGVVDFFVPRSAFLRLDGDSAVLPAGTRLEGFRLAIDHPGGYQVRLRDMRLVTSTSSAAKKGGILPFAPGAMPFMLSADVAVQQFFGWNGSPFHGGQLPDLWLGMIEHADAVHPTLSAGDLPVADAVGAVSYPISGTVNGLTKPRAALLMEQQVLFLQAAQQKWTADTGQQGPLAHTFVLNTQARLEFGSPVPHTWVYTNQGDRSRDGVYQARAIESLARGAWQARYLPGFQTVRDLSATVCFGWLNWLNSAWASLDGVVIGGVRVYGPPTDYNNPAVAPIQTLREDPGAAALILRAAMWLKLSRPSFTAVCDALMLRAWQYLELLWVETGPMRYTWSPQPEAAQWYGAWHFEIIGSLALLLTEGARPAAIPAETIRQRLQLTQTWLKEIGVK